VVLESSDNDSGSSDDEEHLEGVRTLRLARRTNAWLAVYPGDSLRCIEGEHAVESHNWSLRMSRIAAGSTSLDERGGFSGAARAGDPAFAAQYSTKFASQGMNTAKEKLFVTLNFLAHCHTLL
jgi:hypothetical protein